MHPDYPTTYDVRGKKNLAAEFQLHYPFGLRELSCRQTFFPLPVQNTWTFSQACMCIGYLGTIAVGRQLFNMYGQLYSSLVNTQAIPGPAASGCAWRILLVSTFENFCLQISCKFRTFKGNFCRVSHVMSMFISYIFSNEEAESLDSPSL